MSKETEWRRRRQIGRWLVSTSLVHVPLLNAYYRVTLKIIVKGLCGNTKQLEIATIGSSNLALARKSCFKLARNFMHDTYQLHNKVRLTQDENS